MMKSQNDYMYVQILSHDFNTPIEVVEYLWIENKCNIEDVKKILSKDKEKIVTNYYREIAHIAKEKPKRIIPMQNFKANLKPSGPQILDLFSIGDLCIQNSNSGELADKIKSINPVPLFPIQHFMPKENPSKPNIEIEEEIKKLKISDNPPPAKPPRPKIKGNIPAKYLTPCSKITQWIEVGIKEITELCRYDMKYDNVKEIDFVCPICRCEYYENMFTLTDSEIEKMENQMKEGILAPNIVIFSKCSNHFYHKECAENMCRDSQSVKCAVCGYIYGMLYGDMPSGKMNFQKNPKLHCAGYETFGTIEISYQFPSGVRNGINYTGTNRRAYLPDNEEGNEILNLLQKAFERKLSFTIGTSVTTGQTNCVVWNGIHHKTCTSGGPTNFGYPDPTYFNRIKQELAAKGIFSDSK